MKTRILNTIKLTMLINILALSSCSKEAEKSPESFSATVLIDSTTVNFVATNNAIFAEPGNGFLSIFALNDGDESIEVTITDYDGAGDYIIGDIFDSVEESNGTVWLNSPSGSWAAYEADTKGIVTVSSDDGTNMIGTFSFFAGDDDEVEVKSGAFVINK